VLVLLAILVTVVGRVEYELYIKKLAETKTFEEIDRKINEDIDTINKGNFKGRILGNILDHKELWEQVKELKLKMQYYGHT
jgi:hypothetical protein